MIKYNTLTKETAEIVSPILVNLIADMTHWPAWTKEQFLKELPEKWKLSFLALDDEGSIIGFCIMSRPHKWQVHIHLLAIHPTYRGQGIGSLMLDEVKRRICMDLLTLKVFKNDYDAIRFYVRHGFKFTKMTTDSLWWPMERSGK